ncbi:ATP-binding protein [Phenylobacterium sp.]|uniref:ATP-binding protein n=1 Tax=Phenylobacterium sp. TaxID=1871053 RepID=UPI0025D95735|nr:ATP-binding protein [Phenylobacterium sp.]
MLADRSADPLADEAAAFPRVDPHAVSAERPEHVARAYAPVLRWFLAATACYYAIIAVSHVFDETGLTRVALVLLASCSCAAPFSAWLRLRRDPVPSLRWLEVVAALTYGLFFTNVAMHELLAFRPERLVYFVFMAMVFGVTAPTLRVGYAAIGGALAGMFVLGSRMGAAFFDMYAFVGLAGGFAAVGMAAILRGVVTREIRARILSESLLLEAQSATRARSAFLATVSHEIRTPLNAVLGMAQAMRGAPLPGAQAGRLDILQREGRALGQILDDILDVVGLEANDVRLRPSAFDLGGFARALDRLYAPIARDKGVGLAVTVADAGAGHCVADEARLRQVAANLVANAIKFTPAGGAVAVSIDADADRLVLCVEDNGIGIPHAVQTRIFEPFALGDDAITRSAGGAGLGLAICRQLVTLMGGTIELSSEPGAGARFTVRTPMARAPAEASGPDGGAVVGVARALVVDDNATNRLVLRTLLEGLGLECQLVESGVEAVDALASGAWDVILMDVHMPQMDGVAATRAIRALEAREGRARTPIVAVTASVLPEDIERYEAAGMDGVVAKPVALDALAGALVRALCEPAEDRGQTGEGPIAVVA